MAGLQDGRRVPLQALVGFCSEALEKVGVPRESAALVAKSLSDADACGLASHGAVRLLPVYLSRLETGSTRARPKITVERRRGNAALVDGGAGLGAVVGHYAMDLAIAMARESGIGIVGVRQSSHFGTGAFYMGQATRAGMIGIAMTNAPSNMPPAGGRSKFFGTNPLAIGLPYAPGRPIVLDMSTSVVARGKIVMADKNGESIPLGWAIDEEGKPTRDTAAALRGAVLPMAGYKGAGLALMIDAFCGVLTGAAFGPHIVDLYDTGDQPQNVGHGFIAVDVEVFMPLDSFTARLDQFAQEVRSQPRQPDVDRIFLPGELEQERGPARKRRRLRAASDCRRSTLAHGRPAIGRRRLRQGQLLPGDPIRRRHREDGDRSEGSLWAGADDPAGRQLRRSAGACQRRGIRPDCRDLHA